MAANEKDGKRSPGRPQNPVQRKDLVGVAREQFANSGFAGTSMNDIAKSVGLRKSSLFHHFDTKNALYKEVVLGIIRELDDLIASVGSLEGSYGERLDRLNDLIIDYMGTHPWAALLVVREALDERLFAEEGELASVAGALERLSLFLRAGMKDGVFAQDDPKHLAFAIVALHFLHYAASNLTSRFFGQEIFSAKAIDQRKPLIKNQIRRMCGLPEA